MWNALTEKFTALSTHIIADMQARFNNMKCPNSGNICTHLTSLRMKYEELCAVGMVLTDNQYATHIIGSLPYYYQRYLSTVTSAAKAALFANNAARAAAAATTVPRNTAIAAFTITSGSLATAQGISLDPAYIMQLPIEEYDQVCLGKKIFQENKPQAEDTGVALAAPSGSYSGNKGKGKERERHPKGVCWNCGGCGHAQSKCPSPQAS